MKFLARAAAGSLLVLLALATAFYLNPIWFSDRLIRFSLWRQGVESTYAEVDGIRIHYFEAKPANGPAMPLLLVHGLGSRGEDWASLIPKFAASGFDVYVPDMPGYGRSAKPDVDYSIALQAKIVEDFMHTVGVSKADVVGWSMGGWVAARLTLDRPETVDRLVLYDSAGVYFPSFDTSLFTPDDIAGLNRLLAALQPHPPAMPAFAARAAFKLLQSNAWVVRRSVVSMSGGRDLLDFRLHEITQPTLIVWGAADTLIPPSVAESMHSLIANSSLTLVEGCGHLAPVQCAPAVIPVTLRFLKSDPPMTPTVETLPHP